MVEFEAKTHQSSAGQSQSAANIDATFAKELAAESHQDIFKCYQCLRCVSGCPMAEYADLGPADILRLALMGAREEALASPAIWMCVSCETCGSRCPMEINMARVNDELRRLAVKEKLAAPDNSISKFHNIFLNLVKTRGRMNEPLLMAHYKWQTREFAQDMMLGVWMLRKGKLNPFAKKHRQAAEIRKIFEEQK
jgi:heterodisulfide reductase subunit C